MIGIYNKDTDKITELAGISEIPTWTGTTAEFEALDKSTLQNGTYLNITDDETNIIDDTEAGSGKTYSSNKIESKLSDITQASTSEEYLEDAIKNNIDTWLPNNNSSKVVNIVCRGNEYQLLCSKKDSNNWSCLTNGLSANWIVQYKDGVRTVKKLATTDDVVVSELIEHSYTLPANSTYTKTGLDVAKDEYTLILAVCEATGGNEAYCYNCMLSGGNLLNLQFRNITSSNLNLTARIRCLYRKN